MDYAKKSLHLHHELQGKIEIRNKLDIKSLDDLCLVYTPGVASTCLHIAENENTANDYTLKGNTIAVVSDGSAVLGLGNIGPKAAIPVMEGKAMLFKALANVNAIPICLDTQDTDEIVQTIKVMAPCFGAINLEDISAPRCFEIEEKLKKELNIPVFHDDQHGTAVCVLAGLINAHKVVNKDLQHSNIVVNGAGAAGTAITKLLFSYGCRNILVVDQKGIIAKDKPETMLNSSHNNLAQLTNMNCKHGLLADALAAADVFIGVSKPNLVTRAMVSSMRENPIIFALANPIPEILPAEAKAGGAAVIGTGRPDFPNMINNIMAFPGIIKGVLEARTTQINSNILIAAAEELANFVTEEKLNSEHIFPHPLDKEVANTVANAVVVATKSH